MGMHASAVCPEGFSREPKRTMQSESSLHATRGLFALTHSWPSNILYLVVRCRYYYGVVMLRSILI